MLNKLKYLLKYIYKLILSYLIRYHMSSLKYVLFLCRSYFIDNPYHFLVIEIHYLAFFHPRTSLISSLTFFSVSIPNLPATAKYGAEPTGS